jgi:hypothetical protein
MQHLYDAKAHRNTVRLYFGTARIAAAAANEFKILPIVVNVAHQSLPQSRLLKYR